MLRSVVSVLLLFAATTQAVVMHSAADHPVDEFYLDLLRRSQEVANLRGEIANHGDVMKLLVENLTATKSVMLRSDPTMLRSDETSDETSDEASNEADSMFPMSPSSMMPMMPPMMDPSHLASFIPGFLYHIPVSLNYVRPTAFDKSTGRPSQWGFIFPPKLKTYGNFACGCPVFFTRMAWNNVEMMAQNCANFQKPWHAGAIQMIQNKGSAKRCSVINQIVSTVNMDYMASSGWDASMVKDVCGIPMFSD